MEKIQETENCEDFSLTQFKMTKNLTFILRDKIWYHIYIESNKNKKQKQELRVKFYSQHSTRHLTGYKSCAQRANKIQAGVSCICYAMNFLSL